jgi:hypothetical protein
MQEPPVTYNTRASEKVNVTGLVGAAYKAERRAKPMPHIKSLTGRPTVIQSRHRRPHAFPANMFRSDEPTTSASLTGLTVRPQDSCYSPARLTMRREYTVESSYHELDWQCHGPTAMVPRPAPSALTIQRWMPRLLGRQ